MHFGKLFPFLCLCVYIRFALGLDIMKHPHWRLLPSEECGFSAPLDRIIGGKKATLGQYPWIARLGYISTCAKEPVFQCGATLINTRYVITASHCVVNLPPAPCAEKRQTQERLKLAVVRLGENIITKDIDCENDICAEPVQDIVPETVASHRSYGTPMYKHDLALIRLSRAPDLNGWVYPICMPRYDQLINSYEGVNAEVAGFGIVDMDTKAASDSLMTLTVPVTNTKECAQLYNNIADVGDTQICAGGTIGEDSCGGDSGGPLMTIEAKNGRPPAYYLLGVVSFGTTICASTVQPGIYTKMAKYLPWVLDTIRP